MIFIGLLAGYFTLFCAGFGVVLLLMRGAPRLNILECCALGWFFGTGIVSLLLWIGGFFLFGVPLPVVVTACCLALGLGVWIKTSRSQTRMFLPRPRNLWEWICLVLLACELAIVLWISLKRALGWDGLLMWESKARFAFLSDYVLPPSYYLSGRSLTHPEYPLGLPFTELWLYIWMGEAHQLWLKPLFAIFYAFGVIQLAILGFRLTGQRWVACLSPVLFFFVPHELIRVGGATFGYVDFPLSVVYLTAIGYLLLALKNGSKQDLRIYLAALALLPWLKREGAILWVIAALAGAVVLFVQRRPRGWWLALAPGALIIFGWAAYLQAMDLQVPPEFSSISPATFLQNAGRLIGTFQTLFEEVTDLERWSLFWLMATLAVLSLIMRIRKLESAILAGAVLVPILAYCSIYVFSNTVDYVVHVKLSLPRLLMHVVPLLWIAIASAVATPFWLKNSSPVALNDSPAP